MTRMSGPVASVDRHSLRGESFLKPFRSVTLCVPGDRLPALGATEANKSGPPPGRSSFKNTLLT